MENLLPALLVVSLALAFDFVIGDPPNRIHPLRWMGNLLDHLDSRIDRAGKASTRLKGFFSYILLLAITVIICLGVLAAARNLIGDWAWILLTAVLFKLSFAVYSFRSHCQPIENDLRRGDLPSARDKVQMVVSRDTSTLGEEHIASCCVETVAENLVDSVYSPNFYFGLLGVFGAFMFRCANLMDAMWGYRNEKYGDLGFFPARWDDVLGFVTARLSVPFLALSIWIVGGDIRGLWEAVKADHAKTPSPNSGWPMAAVAGGLGLGMEKRGVYRMGKGPLPRVDDIRRSYQLIEISSILFVFLVTLPLYIFIGMDVQIFLEDALWGVLGG
ncbi:MAG: adenosylcobinamide-phosphate synthase CbiB [Candidatus Methanomethylophilaceae archaeon]|nr:adenosylcobinamide-phosphate synthase CbiB [Candidatus Methanomethylophilaceae archaeon]